MKVREKINGGSTSNSDRHSNSNKPGTATKQILHMIVKVVMALSTLYLGKSGILAYYSHARFSEPTVVYSNRERY